MSYNEKQNGNIIINNYGTTQVPNSDFWEEVVDVPTSNWILDMDKFESDTPSRKKGMTFQDEINKRVKGVTFIFSACKQLRLSRSVGLTAATCFHRFYMFESLSAYHYFEVGATALFVACKAEECRRNLKDVVKVCAKIASGKPTPIDEESKAYWRWKDLIVKIEELMLLHLNFDVTPVNPYKVTMDALKLNIELDECKAPNKSWDEQAKKVFGSCTYLFEIFSRLPICLFFPVECISALTVVLSAKKCEVTFPLDFLLSTFQVDVKNVLKCYNDVISLSTEVESLDKYFRILPYIPRTSQIEIEQFLRGTEKSTMDDSDAS